MAPRGTALRRSRGATSEARPRSRSRSPGQTSRKNARGPLPQLKDWVLVRAASRFWKDAVPALVSKVTAGLEEDPTFCLVLPNLLALRHGFGVSKPFSEMSGVACKDIRPYHGSDQTQLRAILLKAIRDVRIASRGASIGRAAARPPPAAPPQVEPRASEEAAEQDWIVAAAPQGGSIPEPTMSADCAADSERDPTAQQASVGNRPEPTNAEFASEPAAEAEAKDIVATPWAPAGDGVEQGIGVQMSRPAEAIPQLPGEVTTMPKVHRMYLRRADFEEHGFTEHCRGCRWLRTRQGKQQTHSTPCRRRIEQLLEGTPEGAAGLAQAEEIIARTIADAVEQGAVADPGGGGAIAAVPESTTAPAESTTAPAATSATSAAPASTSTSASSAGLAAPPIPQLPETPQAPLTPQRAQGSERALMRQESGQKDLNLQCARHEAPGAVPGAVPTQRKGRAHAQLQAKRYTELTAMIARAFQSKGGSMEVSRQELKAALGSGVGEEELSDSLRKLDEENKVFLSGDLVFLI